MTKNKKFDPKKYLGKKRVFQSLSGYNMISRLWIWDEEKGKYSSPQRGKRYFARRYVFKGKRRFRSNPKSFHTIEEATLWQVSGNEAEEETQNMCDTEARSDEKKGTYTFKDLIRDFRERRLPLLSAGSVRFYENRIPHFSFFDDYDVLDIKPKVIDKWIKWLNSKEKQKTYQSSRVSFEREYVCLKAILGWFVQQNDDVIYMLPFKERHIEALTKPLFGNQKTIAYMTDSQYQLWLKTLKKHFPEVYPLAKFQKEQVKRLSEVCGMKWQHLDLKAKTYKLCQSVEWIRGKGIKPKLKDGTKTIKPGDFEVLQLRESVVESLLEIEPEKTCELIFHNKGKLWNYREIQYRYDKAFEMAELPFSGTHILRHTGATDFLNETEDELALTAMGGWKSTKQARHYGKLMGLTVRKVIENADRKRKKAM